MPALALITTGGVPAGRRRKLPVLWGNGVGVERRSGVCPLLLPPAPGNPGMLATGGASMQDRRTGRRVRVPRISGGFT